MPRTIALDFDGVIHLYSSPWTNHCTISDPPTPGAFKFILKLLDGGWDAIVHTSRLQHHMAGEALVRWFIKHGFPAARLSDEAVYHSDIREATYVSPRDQLQDEFPTLATKPPLLGFSAVNPSACVTLDDRALTFTGPWPDLEELARFKPWNR